MFEEREMSEEKRVEIDRSAPFESVKEAVTLFEAAAFSKTTSNNLLFKDDLDIAKIDEEAKELERHLFLKERETLLVLNQLQNTKLKLQLLHQQHPTLNNHPIHSPNLILEDLQRAKLNLTRTTTDLAHIRASVRLYSDNIQNERLSLDQTRHRLALNSSQVSSLEQQLNNTQTKLQLYHKTADANVSIGLPHLDSEADQFKKMGEAARTQVFRAISEIEDTKMKLETAEITLVAANKMKEAARAAEAVALAEIKALSKDESSSEQMSETVTLSSEEYSSLIHKARDAEEQANKRVIDAMLHVDEANVSKMEILQKVEEATEEVKSTKKALEEALNRVEAANKGKLAVEETLRKWRLEHGHKRRIVHNSTKFKNSYQHRRESCLLDVNGQNLASDGSTPLLKPTLSIGQILSKKLLTPEELETRSLAERSNMTRKVSLAQMLHKQNAELTFAHNVESHRQFSAKRKKFGFGRFSLLLTKQSKKNKPTLDLR